jgi:hypothetical protein
MEARREWLTGHAIPATQTTKTLGILGMSYLETGIWYNGSRRDRLGKNGTDSASRQHGVSEVKSSHFAAREFLLRFSKHYLMQIIFGYELMIQCLALALLFCLLCAYKRIW